MRVVAAGLLLAQLSSSQAAWAHGDVHVEIDALSTQLSARPRSAELRSRRGLLYAKDGDWPAAARDLELAWSLSPEDATVGHDLANALFEAGQPAQAVEVLEEVLRIDPAHSDSYRVRARAQQALGLFAEAELDFDRAVSLRTRAEPGVYLERARMLADLDDAAVERGLAGLSEAAQRLGPLVSLVELAVQLEQQRGRTDAALGWLDQLPWVARTSPKWRARRASLLLELGREQEAEEELLAAREGIDQLPPDRRSASAMVEERSRIEARLAEISTARAPEAAPPSSERTWWWLVGGLGLAAWFGWRRAKRSFE